MDDPAPHAAGLTRRRILAAIKVIYGIMAAGVLVWALWDAWRSPGVLSQIASGPGQIAFVVCWMLMAGVLGLAWAQVVKTYLGLHLPVREWLPIQGAAWVGRYLPGKVGLLAGKLSLLEKENVKVSSLTFSVLFEQLAFVATGLALAISVSLPLAKGWIGQWVSGEEGAWFQSARILTACAICVSFIPALNLLASRFRIVSRPMVAQAAMILILYLVAHALAGLGLQLTLRDVLSGDAPGLIYVISLLAAANVAGIVALFAPAGIGVREAVLVVGFAPYMSTSDAVALAALLRVLTLFADSLFVLLTGGFALLTRRSCSRR